MTQSAMEWLDERKPELSQWYTPAPLAAAIVKWALSDGYDASDVLEPSAGRGALAHATREAGCDVTCVDIDAFNAQHLADAGFRSIHGNFLTWQPGERFDLAIMNPPFENGATESHIMHALSMCDVVVCHCPLTTLAGQTRREALWAKAELTRLVIHSTRPKYGADGGMTDMCTIEVCRRLEREPAIVAQPTVEWWP